MKLTENLVAELRKNSENLSKHVYGSLSSINAVATIYDSIKELSLTAFKYLLESIKAETISSKWIAST